MYCGVIRGATVALLLFVSVYSEITAAAERAETSERGFYVGASASRAEQDVVGEEEMLVGVFGGPFGGFIVMLQPDQVEIDDVDVSWNVTLGYRINQYLAAELSYFDFGSVSVTERYLPTTLLPIITVHSAIDTFGPGLSLLGSWPVTPALDVFVRGGVLFIDQELERSIDGFRSERRAGDETWVGGVGAQWAFASRWTARLEYQRTGTIDYGRSDTVAAGAEKAEQLSLSVLFNL